MNSKKNTNSRIRRRGTENASYNKSNLGLSSTKTARNYEIGSGEGILALPCTLPTGNHHKKDKRKSIQQFDATSTLNSGILEKNYENERKD